ncbi:hypothetical protein PtrSN002B_002218 [Pyrenophora tritici-repentis]|uniref:Uncharacterized protein n=2 Tax=Pyrenophora tritici-repentis TaxID=45151 RepID=A0A2W1EA82_9PLEO|nr:uncharacterized protein PTRG_04344 [Pyrenophora tritici-repentis Pt-1C-BFP]KAF7447708.1 hypothetical protein A1F99_070720 [Pyrenophora tritici-repentis]EDU47182.1 predicted protein [Pyrenophora tritici-repentis Pt-1C-BFP]KAG9385364.1 hypothetical protein A1F94_004911 [Pyrenophora tritici-repentis]KAI0589430.1 hypothetical protein Alg130_02929 [Pyrenophora tritici-repentis]KAI0609899.1 hypothetical protein TUN205_05877 [Pyrenophora tritici-repentis]
MKLSPILLTATLTTLAVAVATPNPACTHTPASPSIPSPTPLVPPAGKGLMDDYAFPHNNLPPSGIANTDARRDSMARRAWVVRQAKESMKYVDAEGYVEKEVEELALALDAADENGVGSG